MRERSPLAGSSNPASARACFPAARANWVFNPHRNKRPRIPDVLPEIEALHFGGKSSRECASIETRDGTNSRASLQLVGKQFVHRVSQWGEDAHARDNHSSSHGGKLFCFGEPGARATGVLHTIKHQFLHRTPHDFRIALRSLTLQARLKFTPATSESRSPSTVPARCWTTSQRMVWLLAVARRYGLPRGKPDRGWRG